MRTPRSTIRTLVKVSCLATGIAALGLQPVTAQVVDDFESYTAGALETVASPPWDYETTGLASIESDAGNQYLTLAGDGDWRYFNRATGVPIDSAGSSFSFSVYVDGETGLDHAIGLTEFDGAEADWYADYGPYVRITDDTAGAAGVVSLDVRSGGGFIDDIATLTIGQWYSVRFDIDPTSGSGVFDVYVDDVLAGAGNYGFRFGYANPLDTVLIMGGQNVESNVRFDNIAVVVPEPGTIALFIGGYALLIGYGRSRRTS